MGNALTIKGLTSARECEEIAHWAREARVLLEVGRLQGRTTAVIASAMRSDAKLVSIDHHRGDRNTGETSFEECKRNVETFVEGKDVTLCNEAFEEVLPALREQFDFVFYDAMHTTEACEKFWECVVGKLQARCVLLYDDADWKEMWRLGELARAAGFREVTRFALQRNEGGKDDQAAELAPRGDYTVAVYLREEEV